jgi:two-component system sensor histidine kinase DesK
VTAATGEDRAATLRAYEFTSSQWPVWRFEASPAAAWRNIVAPIVFLVFLYTPVRTFVTGQHPAAQKFAYVAVIALYAVSYVGAMFVRVRKPLGRRGRVILVAWMFVLGGTLPVIILDAEAIPFITYAIVISVLMLPLRYSRAIGLAVVVLQILITWQAEGHVDWDGTWTLILVTVSVTSLLMLGNTISSLREANNMIADLAVTEERSRFARDLHDLLGHSLTTITVKSGLARRVLETGADPARAVAEVRDVEELSRKALVEVRAAVSGYHQISLAAELLTAKAALRAAGIEAVLPGSVDELRLELREPFAWVLREGVTNVVKHSGASRCEVRVGPDWLEVRDNGSSAGAVAGNGLRGLRDRLAGSGAVVSWDCSEGFVLRASV